MVGGTQQPSSCTDGVNPEEPMLCGGKHGYRPTFLHFDNYASIFESILGFPGVFMVVCFAVLFGFFPTCLSLFEQSCRLKHFTRYLQNGSRLETNSEGIKVAEASEDRLEWNRTSGNQGNKHPVLIFD